MSNIQQELADFIETFPKTEWVNSHLERFIIHSNGISVFMSGDEVNAMVPKQHLIAGKYLSLFNPLFSIWNKDELNNLGLALIEVIQKIDSN